MEKLVEYLAKNIVDDPDEVRVKMESEDGRDLLKLSVASEDMGKIIGKSGKVIKAIRTLVKIKAIKENKRVYIELAE